MVFLRGVGDRLNYFIHEVKGYEMVRDRHKECRCNTKSLPGCLSTWAQCLDSLMFRSVAAPQHIRTSMKAFTPHIQKDICINACEILPQVFWKSKEPAPQTTVQSLVPRNVNSSLKLLNSKWWDVLLQTQSISFDCLEISVLIWVIYFFPFYSFECCILPYVKRFLKVSKWLVMGLEWELN